MAAPFNVRLFVYRGIRDINTVLPKQFSSDSVKVNDDPTLSSQVVAVAATGQAYESVPDAADVGSTCAIIEVPDNQAVRYELNQLGPAGAGHRNASTTSRRITGDHVINWGPGFSISVIDASTLL